MVLGLLCLGVNSDSFASRMGRQLFNRLSGFISRVHTGKQELCRVDSTEGTCVSQSQCNNLDGKYAGFCKTSNHVCCIVRKTCGDEVKAGLSYFENPKYPEGEDVPRTCDLEVKIGAGMCAVRLEMDTFELAPFSDDVCLTDTMTILGSPEISTPFCGLMTNWTTTIRVKEFSELKLAAVLQGTPKYRFSIRIIQIPCTDIVRFHSPSYSGIMNEDARIYERPTTTTPEPTTTEAVTETTVMDTTTMEPEPDTEPTVTEETTTNKPKPTTLKPGKIVKPVIREVVIKAQESPDDIEIEDTIDRVPSISIQKKIWDKRMKDLCWERNKKDQPSERVIGGGDSKINEFPWQVALVYKKKFFCGGSLISDRYVLTAGHCIFGSFGKGLDNFLVTAGDHDLRNKNESDNKVSRVKKIHWHLNYSTYNIYNDIAILELERALNFSYGISAVRLPSDLNEKYDDVNGIVSGWGRFDTKTKASSPVLKWHTAPMVEIEECVKRWNLYPGAKAIAKNNICLNVTMGTPCHGDSGGPLVVCNHVHCSQVGVVSFGFPLCTNVGLPAVFSRVTHYMPWIDAELTTLSYTNVA